MLISTGKKYKKKYGTKIRGKNTGKKYGEIRKTIRGKSTGKQIRENKVRSQQG
jgi:hypothetical protein